LLTTYDFNKNTIRVVEIDGEPWFVVRDVTNLLNFQTTAGSGWLTKHLLPEEVRTIRISEGKRGNPNKVVVSESGLYKLILRAQRANPVAREFQDWVTRVVLPAIRKDGAYVSGEEKLASGEMSEDEFVLKVMPNLKGGLGKTAQGALDKPTPLFLGFLCAPE
jgi:prophage antirepressor-like protein